MADLSPERESAETSCMLVHTLAPSLGLGLERAGLGLGCAISNFLRLWDREVVRKEPPLEELRKAEHLVYIMSTTEVDHFGQVQQAQWHGTSLVTGPLEDQGSNREGSLQSPHRG